MKLAIVADWLPTFGGAEHVIDSMHRLFPDAPIFTTVARREALQSLSDASIHTHPFLQTLFRFLGTHRVLLPFMPKAIESLDLSAFDCILSSSHAIGKGIIPPSHAVHICYCHTPMRYAWEMEDRYLEDSSIPKFLRRFVRTQLSTLRRWDLSTAKRVDFFLANSSETQARIARIYGRESVVLSPPVADIFFKTPLTSPLQESYIAIGRLVPYKRFDLLIQLANMLRLPLTIAGTGPDEKRLKAMAGDTVRFAGFVSDEALPLLYAQSTALLFPQLEDAGIVPMEAQASGLPVIAFGEGGVKDVVVDEKTGILTSSQTVDAFADAIKKFQLQSFDRASIRESARKFHESTFASSLEKYVEMYYEQKKRIVMK